MRADFDITGEPIFWTEGTEERDTVPAPPVPSTNPIAELRDALEAERSAARYALLGPQWGERHDGWFGLKIEDGLAERVTPQVDADIAHEWLAKARLSAVHGTMPPEFCEKGHLKETVGLCGVCLVGGSK